MINCYRQVTTAESLLPGNRLPKKHETGCEPSHYEKRESMSRRTAREMALQTLFQMDYNDNIAPESALIMVVEEFGTVADKDKEYAIRLVQGARSSLAEIDAIIASSAYEWKIDRMPGVDRNIVRLAIYEMKFGPDAMPPGVVINEAVELAKQYGTEDSARFVNGILGALAKNKEPK